MVLCHLKLYPHHPKMFCTKFGSWEDDFESLSIYFHCFGIISPWKRAWPFIWKTYLIPITKDALCQVLLKLTLWFLRRRCLKFVNVFSLFPYIPLEKGRVPSFEQTWMPISKESFVPSLVEIGPVILENKIFKFCQWIFTISLLSPLGKGRKGLMCT